MDWHTAVYVVEKCAAHGVGNGDGASGAQIALCKSHESLYGMVEVWVDAVEEYAVVAAGYIIMFGIGEHKLYGAPE